MCNIIILSKVTFAYTMYHHICVCCMYVHVQVVTMNQPIVSLLATSALTQTIKVSRISSLRLPMSSYPSTGTLGNLKGNLLQYKKSWLHVCIGNSVLWTALGLLDSASLLVRCAYSYFQGVFVYITWTIDIRIVAVATVNFSLA